MSKATKEVFYKVGLWIWYVMLPIVVSYYTTNELLFNAFAIYPALLCTVLLAVCLSVMDSVENEHIFNTRLRDLNPKFWYKRESSKTPPQLFKYHIDAWHLLKSLSIVIITIGFVTAKPITSQWYYDIAIYGYYYNITFNGFYNQIWKL